LKYFKLFLIVGVVFTIQFITAQSKNDSLNKKMYDTTYSKKMMDSVMKISSQQSKEYEKMMKEQQSKQRGLGSSFFGLNLDVFFGVGISKTEFEMNQDTSGFSNIGTKTGPLLGVNLNMNLIGFAISTGFNFSSKGFTANSNSYNANYMNIPLMFAFNFNIERVGIDVAAGPYIGILLSNDESQQYTLKNLDIGIVGTLQGSYFFNRFLGALVGVKYEQGGLNNLIETGTENNNITSIKTQNWFIYTGMKFVL
jgi:hypothetical protein